MSQFPWKFAAGVPKVLVSGAPEAIESGIALRGKNHIWIAVEVHSIAYTPPPMALKLAPALFGSVAETAHPARRFISRCAGFEDRYA